MMKVKLDSRAEYELHIKKLVAKNLKLKPAMGKTVIALAMQCFDDGMLFNQNRLEVQVNA